VRGGEVLRLRGEHKLKTYLTRRKLLMGYTEEEDLKQIKSQQQDGSN
jgi:hypothetical protein